MPRRPEIGGAFTRSAGSTWSIPNGDWGPWAPDLTGPYPKCGSTCSRLLRRSARTMRSPGSRVKMVEQWAIRCLTGNIICPVAASCRVSPFTRNWIRRPDGSTPRGSTKTPSGANVSKPFATDQGQWPLTIGLKHVLVCQGLGLTDRIVHLSSPRFPRAGRFPCV